MNETTEDQGANFNRDRFLSRLAAAATCAIALITTGWVSYFAFVRAPNLRQLAHDLGMPLPLATDITLRQPRILVATAVIALITGIAAWARPRRTVLIVSYALTLLAVALAVAAEVAVRWPIEEVLRSVASPPPH